MNTDFIFNFCLDVFNGFIGMVSSVLSWLSSSITINDIDYPVITLMFGAGITIYFGFMIVKWLI